MSNEGVGKVPEGSWYAGIGGAQTLPDTTIAAPERFWEVDFHQYALPILSNEFFYSFNVQIGRAHV